MTGVAMRGEIVLLAVGNAGSMRLAFVGSWEQGSAHVLECACNSCPVLIA